MHCLGSCLGGGGDASCCWWLGSYVEDSVHKSIQQGRIESCIHDSPQVCGVCRRGVGTDPADDRFSFTTGPGVRPSSPPSHVLLAPVLSSCGQETTTEPVVNGELSVPVMDGAAFRIIGLDPSLSCGISVLQMGAQDEILSIDTGLLDVSCKTLTTAGARCNELQRLLTPFLSAPVDMVYIESFYVSPFRDSRDGRWKVNQEGVDVNYKLRGALEMALDRHAIPYSFVAPQTWKNAVVGDGMAEKAVIKEIIERKMGFRFPPRLFSRGRYMS